MVLNQNFLSAGLVGRSQLNRSKAWA